MLYMGGCINERNVLNSVVCSSLRVVDFLVVLRVLLLQNFGIFLRMWHVGYGFGEIFPRSRMRVEEFHM